MHVCIYSHYKGLLIISIHTQRLEILHTTTSVEAAMGRDITMTTLIERFQGNCV